MPSRSSGALRYQVDSHGLGTRKTKEGFAPLASIADDAEMQYVLDSQDCKHCDTSQIEYEGYALQEEPLTSCDSFDLPGLASASGLRAYLRQTLLPKLILNEYGDVCDLSEIPLDHLVALQAPLWTKVFDARSPTKPPAERPSRAHVLAAGHIARISQLLEEKHIFVASNATFNACQYLRELQITTTHAYESPVVRLEPLVHWGTVTPATASRSIFVFRRDGELMQQPEYIQLVRRLVDTEAPTYCVDCLHHLWNKRAEARDTMRQLLGSVKQLDPCETEDEVSSREDSTLKSFSGTSEDEGASDSGKSARPATHHSKQATGTDVYEDFEKAMPQLDGESSDLEELQFPQAPSSSRKKDAIRVSSDSCKAREQIAASTQLMCRKDSFTLPLRTTSTSLKRSNDDCGLSTPVLSTIVPSSTSTRTVGVLEKKKLVIDKAQNDKDGLKIIDLITPPRIKERKFGHELDTNTKVSLIELRRSPRRQKTDVVFLKENLSPAVQPMKPLKAGLKVDPSTKDTKKRKTASLNGQTVKQKKPRISIVGKPATTQNDGHGKMNGTPQVPEQKPAPRPPSPVKLILNFAKRPASIEIPDGIATLTYEDFQNMTPAPTAKVCWCNKPAGYSTHKKNDHPHISQCTNFNCQFRWYHYACLNQSDKGKARFGNLFCQICRNEQEFAEQDKTRGWNVEKLMNPETLWKKGDIEVQMPILGGHVPMANPYGVGMEVALGPAYLTETEAKANETLGALDSLGYSQSHPYMLEEAYLNASAYAGLRADLALDEEADEEWWYETRAAENEYSHSEEVYEETEEEF